VTREIAVMQGIADDLKRFIATNLRDSVSAPLRGPRIVDTARLDPARVGAVVS